MAEMAVGAPQPGTAGDYVLYVDAPRVVKRASWRKGFVAVGLVSVVVCAAVMFAATPHDEEDAVLLNKVAKIGIIKSLKNELKASKDTDSALAGALVHHAATLSVSGLKNMIDNWKDQQISDLDQAVPQKGMMLAQMHAAITSSLEEESQLCAKKEIIFAKFNELLKKLGHENIERNATDQAAYEAKQAALESWLDGESSFRLEVEKAKEAKAGATYARSEYEKWTDATKATQASLDAMNVRYPKEKAGIAAEREMIKTIMRLLGIMDDQPVDATSAAAGGYMNDQIDHPNAPEAAAKAMPSKQTLVMIKQQIAKLKASAAAGGPIKMSLVNALKSKLASFAETDYVKTLLMQMLKDLDLRDEVLDSAKATTEAELASHKEKLTKYEVEVVNLSNAGDKAEEQAAARNLERQKLNGNKINTDETYNNEHAEFSIVAPPSDRAIYILKKIMQKITDYCAGDASAMAA